MHGVGTKWVQKSYEKFSHKPLLAVPSQAAPDPDFKTVKFPNPEEKGALLEAMKFANENNASLIVANDPDADRLAIAEKKHFEKNIASENDLVTSTGEKINNFDANNINNNNNINNIEEEWHIFSGNEIGVLLGYWSIMNYKEKVNNIHISNDNSNYNNNINNNNSQIRKTTLEIEKYPVAVLASVVSSRMLKKIAEVEGVQYFDTLTGFFILFIFLFFFLLFAFHYFKLAL
jgi:phosphomannomutase